MILMTTMTLLMTPFLSPLKVAFSVTTISVTLSLTLYGSTSSVFPASGVVISFSSGMMILFCYCAMMSNYESKNSGVMVWGVFLLMIMAWSIWESENITISSKEILVAMCSPLLICSMGAIIIAMVCINKSMFTPTKSLVGSY